MEIGGVDCGEGGSGGEGEGVWKEGKVLLAGVCLYMCVLLVWDGVTDWILFWCSGRGRFGVAGIERKERKPVDIEGGIGPWPEIS